MNPNRNRLVTRWAVVCVLMMQVWLSTALGGGKVGVYGIRMVPYGLDAEQYSRPGWGLGIHAVLPLPQAANTIAGTVGIEFVNLLSHTETFVDNLTLLRIEQQTDQSYSRLYVGGQVGGHGSGFFRPHAGVNLAVVYYNIKTDVVVPDDYDREQEIRQKLRDEGQFAFGYDLTLGLDLNFSNSVAVDGGVRYLKSFSLPEQLGDGSVTIYPQYVQVYVGVGLSFELLNL